MTQGNVLLRSLPFGIILADGENPVPSEVQILRVGTFYHPSYGKMEITKEYLEQMVRNFKEQVRRVDLAIDYKHESDDKAAGWIKDLEIRNGDQLWATVKWTSEAKRALADGEFRYLSADFHPDYQDNESLKKFGPTLMGAGLTNRPFVKDMSPTLELQEGPGPKTPLKEEPTKPKKKEIKKMSDSKKLEEMTVEELRAHAAEIQAKNEALAKDKGELEKAQGIAKREGEFSALLSEGKAVPAQKEAYMAGDMKKFAELAQELNTKGKGTGTEPPVKKEEIDPSKDPSVQFMEIANKLVTDEKAQTLDDAIKMTIKSHPELYKKHEQKFNWR